MNQRSRRSRLSEWAALVDAEVPERALERSTLSAFSDSQGSGDPNERDAESDTCPNPRESR